MRCDKKGIGTTIAAVLLLFTACNEPAGGGSESGGEAGLSAVGGEEGTETITDIAVAEGDDASELGYTPADFSSYVYTVSSGNAYLVDFNFFPSGTDFDSQNGRVTLPCARTGDSEDDSEGGATTAVDGEDCDGQIVLDLSGARFTFLGVEFTGAETVDIFAESFGFVITADGFTDASDGEALTVAANEADLEGVYAAVLGRE